MIPITNAAREKALVVAAQQRMTETEVKRRQVTGTLASGSVTAAIAALGLSDENLIAGKMSTAPSGNNTLRMGQESPKCKTQGVCIYLSPSSFQHFVNFEPPANPGQIKSMGQGALNSDHWG